jgi:hypothetical protein
MSKPGLQITLAPSLFMVLSVTIVVMIRLPLLLPDTSFNMHSYQLREIAGGSSDTLETATPHPGPFHFTMIKILSRHHDSIIWAMHTVTVLFFMITCLFVYETVSTAGGDALYSSLTVILFSFLPATCTASTGAGTVFYASLLQVLMFYVCYRQTTFRSLSTSIVTAALYPLFLLLSPDAVMLCLPALVYLVIKSRSILHGMIMILVLSVSTAITIFIMSGITGYPADYPAFWSISGSLFTLRNYQDYTIGIFPIQVLITSLILLPVIISASRGILSRIPASIITITLLLFIPAIVIVILFQRDPLYNTMLPVVPMTLFVLLSFRSNRLLQTALVLSMALLSLLFFTAAGPLPASNRASAFLNKTVLDYTRKGIVEKYRQSLPRFDSANNGSQQ